MGDVAGWMSLAGPSPYRVNLRYAPGRADLRLTGALTAACVPDLIRLFDVLAGLRATVVVDTSAVTSADEVVVAVLTGPAAVGSGRVQARTPGRLSPVGERTDA